VTCSEKDMTTNHEIWLVHKQTDYGPASLRMFISMVELCMC